MMSFLDRHCYILRKTSCIIKPEADTSMKQGQLIKVVEKLITICRDSEKAYKSAAEHIKQEHLKNLFLELSAQRSTFIKELEAELSTLGQVAETDSGSVAAAMRITWMDLEANTGGGDGAVLGSVERGEDIAKEAYADALGHALPLRLDTIIRRQAESVVNAHDTVKSMRDSLAA